MKIAESRGQVHDLRLQLGRMMRNKSLRERELLKGDTESEQTINALQQ